MRYGVGGSEMRDRVGGGGGGERVRDERRSRMGRGRERIWDERRSGRGSVNDGFPYTYYLVTIHSAQSMPRV